MDSIVLRQAGCVLMILPCRQRAIVEMPVTALWRSLHSTRGCQATAKLWEPSMNPGNTGCRLIAWPLAPEVAEGILRLPVAPCATFRSQRTKLIHHSSIALKNATCPGRDPVSSRNVASVFQPCLRWICVLDTSTVTNTWLLRDALGQVTVPHEFH